MLRRKLLFCLILSFAKTTVAQVDYSESWEDFFSYNNVKDFVKVANVIYALADNAVFIYDINTQQTQKHLFPQIHYSQTLWFSSY